MPGRGSRSFSAPGARHREPRVFEGRVHFDFLDRYRQTSGTSDDTGFDRMREQKASDLTIVVEPGLDPEGDSANLARRLGTNPEVGTGIEILMNHPPASQGYVELVDVATVEGLHPGERHPVALGRPRGGFLLWVTLPDGMIADRLLEEAMREKVMFVPGSCYIANGGGESSLRLNFSAYGEEKLACGIERLARAIERSGGSG